MAVIIKIGRRLPQGFAKRLLQRGANILSLQEQVYLLMIKSFRLAKKYADNRPESQIVYTIDSRKDPDYRDLSWKLEWDIVTVTSLDM
jgi:hypothetical protein